MGIIGGKNIKREVHRIMEEIKNASNTNEKTDENKSGDTLEKGM